MNFIEYLDCKTERLKVFFVCFIPFCLALSARALAMLLLTKFSSTHLVYFGDGPDYIQQATNILNGHWQGGFPNGYPLIVALFSIFGSNRDLALIFLNVFLSSLIAGLVAFLVYKRTNSKLSGLAAGSIIAFWYNQVSYSLGIICEPPTGLFLILGILSVMQKKDYSGGFLIGLASVIRTTLLPIAPLFALYKKSYKIFLGFAIPVILIMAAGYFFSGDFSIGGNFGYNIYVSSHLDADGQPIWPAPEDLTTIKAIKIYIRSFFGDPINFIFMRAKEFWLVWGFWPATNPHRMIVDIPLKILIGLRFPLFFGAMYFFFVSKNKSKDDALLLIPILLITITHTMFFSASRHTYVVDPLVVTLFVSHFYFFLQRKKII